MPFIDYATCEPLRVWSRLEPRAREVEFDGALAARVYDATWMLARQWQLGEFKGEDTGSAVLAKLARRLTPIGSVQVGGGVPESEDLALPAEARVERLPRTLPAIERARIGRGFLLGLDEAAAAAPPAGTPYDAAHYRAVFRAAFPIAAPEQPDEDDKAAQARARTELRARRVQSALAGRAVDGFELYRWVAGGIAADDLPSGVIPDHVTLVLSALERFRVAYARQFPAAPAASGWDPGKLEYRAACTVPRAGGTATLTVDEHITGRLDWHAYDQGPIGAPGSGTTTELRSVIPAAAEFAGMPNPRWWQLEDAAVDLGNFRAQATDLAKVVVAEFALLYGNNWFVIPYRQPVGSLAEVEGVVVTDVFGRRTLVRAAVAASGGRWTDWDLFSLSPRGTTPAAPPLPQHLFIPPLAGPLLEAAPHEAVALVRDESADMVWAVEQRVPDGLGASEDGTDLARRFTGALAELEPHAPPGEVAIRLRYRLGTQVPESWIPFIPVHKPAGTREIRLQRGAMPRFVDGETQHVRPRTSILAAPSPSYFLEEEEVPRAGVVVRGAMRRARWVDGRTVVWHGRTVSSGRGETDSGLRFDVIETHDPRG